jgi:mannose-6-phosphate isomerase-like protein (cupin superfamily)
MEFLAGGCRVFGPDEGEAVERGTWTCRTLICRQRGARDIAETVNEYTTGRSPVVLNPSAEEVLYVVRGRGTAHLRGFTYALEPGVGLFVPPGTPYQVENPGGEKLRLVAVCCPEDEGRRVLDDTPEAPALRLALRDSLRSAVRNSGQAGQAPRRTVSERERPPIPVADRQFKLLVTDELGCRRVTQFVGFIPPSKAPFHYHTYEEAIYILEGEGLVHVEGGSCPFRPGTSIYLPVGLRHCLENPGTRPVRLLGAFYPSGSPAVAYETQPRS